MDGKQTKIVEEVERELERILDGATPIEKALALSRGLREVYGGYWEIVAQGGGAYTIRLRGGLAKEGK